MKIKPGDKLNGLPSGDWNRHEDASARVLGSAPNQFNQSSKGLQNALRAWVRNDSGVDIDSHGILKIGDPVITPTARAGVVYDEPVFAGSTPSGSTDLNDLIAVAAVADGAIVRGVIEGYTWCTVNVTSTGHEFAKPTTSAAQLVSDTTDGFPIKWKPSGTGSLKCLIRMQKTGSTTQEVASYVAKRYAASVTDRELVARWDETNTQLEATDETFSMLEYDPADDDFDTTTATDRSAVNLSPFDYNGHRESGNLHPFGAMAMQLGTGMFGLLPTMMDPSSLWFGIQCERTASGPGPLRITQSAAELYNQKLLTCNETNWTVAELLQCSGASAASQPRWARLEKKSLWICPGMDVLIFYGAKFQCRTTLTEETTGTDSGHTHTYESPASFEITLSLLEDYTGASGGDPLPGRVSDYSSTDSDSISMHVMHGVQVTECYENLTGFTVRRHTGETSGKTYGSMRRFDLGITTRMRGASTTYEAQWCDPMSAWMIAIPVRPSLIADVRRWRYDPYDDGAEPFQWYTYDISEPSQYDSDGA